MKFYDLSVLVVEEDGSRRGKIRECLENIGLRRKPTHPIGNPENYLKIHGIEYDFLIAREKPDFSLGKTTYIQAPEDNAASYAFFESKVIKIFSEYKKL